MYKQIIACIFGVFLLAACQGNLGTKSDYGSGKWLRNDDNGCTLQGIDYDNVVFFPFDSSMITDEAKSKLDKIANWWSKDSSVMVIEGHCDARGTREYNLALGERRANAVKRYLVSKNVDSKKIDTISYGKERPAMMGTGEEVWAKNRRGVIVISGK